MESVETQVARCMKMIHSRQTGIDKYMYLSSLKDQNLDLFYRVLIDNVRELMPLVYTPTIGDVCLQYSTLYTRPEALYISIKQRKSIRTILRNWPYQSPEICVVTDGSRILGLGDLGINGVGISVGLPLAQLVVYRSFIANVIIRLESCLFTPELPEFTPRRPSPSSWTAVPIMRVT